jgi:hypothetical protein
MEALLEKTTTLTETQARAIAADAYVYFYPLVLMDLTRRQMTNDEQEFGHGPMNMFVNVAAYPPADFKGIARSNFDTLYSSAWLDLTEEPLVVSAPDTGGRYYLLPMLDMWTDVFASPGWRTTGTEACDFLVTTPGWNGRVPEGFTHLASPTPYVWIIGRTQTDGPADYDAVHKIQAGYKITPLSRWGKTRELLTVKSDPALDVKTPPMEQVDHMAAGAYFAYAARLLKLHPPHPTDQPILAQMKQIGIEVGESFEISRLDPAVRKGIEAAPAEAQHLMHWKLPTLARIANYWLMNTDTMGVYGNYYLKRAIMAQLSLGMNPTEDAIYPVNLADESAEPLDGAHQYTIHFDKGGMPPVRAFWSLTLYDSDGFPVENELDRFALSSWMPLKYNVDGSLDLYLQSESPGWDKEANWLPAPAGPFNLVMRLYAPEADALTGKWNPPPVKKAGASAAQ